MRIDTFNSSINYLLIDETQKCPKRPKNCGGFSEANTSLKRDKISHKPSLVLSRKVVSRRHEKREREKERKEINDFCCSRDEYEQHLEEEAHDDDEKKHTFYQYDENDDEDDDDDDDDDGETTFKPPKQF